MALILNIDTATESASVCMAEDERILAMEHGADQRMHASFVQPAIQNLSAKTGIHLDAIDAVAITAGPGSYTGLRVGLSTAKGLCYALNKPLIMVNTLEVMAIAAIDEDSKNVVTAENSMYCPLVDARRMEVFTAVYTRSLEIVLKPQTLLLDADSFAGQLGNARVVFSGSGSTKLRNILSHPSAVFSDVQHHAAHLAGIALKKFRSASFADLAYSEPYYLKEFYTRQL